MFVVSVLFSTRACYGNFVKFDEGNPLVELRHRQIIPVYCIYLKDPLFPWIAANLFTKQQKIYIKPFELLRFHLALVSDVLRNVCTHYKFK